MNLINEKINLVEEGIENNFKFSIRNGVEKILTTDITNKITKEESKKVAQWIKEENAVHKHMIEKTHEEIYNEVNSGLGFVAKINNEIAGTMMMIEIVLSNGEKIYEAGTLMISPEKRKMGVAKKLCEKIFNENNGKAVYSITEVEGVKKIYNNYLSLESISKYQLNKEILEKIEEVGKLLPTDIIYGNEYFLKLLNYDK